MQAAPPKKKEPRKRQGPESTEGTRPGERQHPAIAESTDEPTVEPEPEKEEKEEPKSAPAQPVTNHDEQEKITNADTLNKPDTNF